MSHDPARWKRFVAVALFMAVIADCGALVGQDSLPPEQPKTKRVRRAARPTFNAADSDGIFFDDLFSEGLIGDRPDAADLPAMVANGDSAGAANGSANGSPGEFAWSQVISGPAIEDEVKSLSQQLDRQLTSPVKFKTGYRATSTLFAKLSMAFGILSQYDGEVRWKDEASIAQAAFGQAMKLARTSDDKSFNYCQQRKLDLTDLVRGGSFPQTEKPPETLDWDRVVDRSTTMLRLESAEQNLKQWTASEDEFADKADDILFESQWVAAIAEVIVRESMDDADDEDYRALGMAMKSAAMDAIDGVKGGDFPATAAAANGISQSCSDCHADWR